MKRMIKEANRPKILHAMLNM